MAPLEPLAPDQRAVVTLVLRQARSYEDIAELLAIPVEAVQARAQAGLAALASNGLPSEITAPLADYLLGQQIERDAAATRGLLAESAPARAWATDVAASLGGLAPGGLPEIPSGEIAGTAPDAPRPGPDSEPPVAPADRGSAASPADAGPAVAPGDARRAAPPGDSGPESAPADSGSPPPAADSGPAEAAPESGPEPALADSGSPPPPADSGPATASAEEGSAPGDEPTAAPPPGGDAPPAASRLGGALLIAAVLAVIAVVLFLVLRGGDDSGGEAAAPTETAAATAAPTATATAAPAQVADRIALRSPTSKARGTMTVYLQDGQLLFGLVARNVPANGGGDAYAVWFTGPGRKVRRLGYTNPVGKDGRLGIQGPGENDLAGFPKLYATYARVVVSRETSQDAKRPGPVILAGKLPEGR